MLSKLTSLLFDPRTTCLAKEAMLLTLTCTLSAKRILESAKRERALLLLADAILISKTNIKLMRFTAYKFDDIHIHMYI